MPLFGVATAAAALDSAVAGYAGADLALVLVTGPPGSGKTTLAAEALGRHGYEVYRPTTDSTPARETASVLRFARAAHSVDALLAGRGARRRAVLLDDVLPDAKSVATVHDALRKAGARVLLVASLCRSAKAPEARRRARAVVPVPYPPAAETAAHLLRAFGPGADPAAAARCAAAAGGCVPKAEQLLRGELCGTVAEQGLRGVDTTIFEDVSRAASLARAGRPFPDVEVAVSAEPAMCALILRESLPRPSPRTREAFRWLSRTPPGGLGPALASAVFLQACLLDAPAPGLRLAFPRCYTTASSRSAATRRRARPGAHDAPG